MNDYLRILLVLLAAVNPASVLLATSTRTRPANVVLGLGAAFAFGAYALMATPTFMTDFQAARTELRQALDYPAEPPAAGAASPK